MEKSVVINSDKTSKVVDTITTIASSDINKQVNSQPLVSSPVPNPFSWEDDDDEVKVEDKSPTSDQTIWFSFMFCGPLKRLPLWIKNVILTVIGTCNIVSLLVCMGF